MNALIKHFITLFYTNFKKAIQRFPLTFFFSALLTLLALIDLYHRSFMFFDYSISSKLLDRFELFAGCMLLITYCLTLYREKQNTSLITSVAYGAIVTAVFGYSLLFTQHLGLASLFLVNASVIILFCAPYFLKPIEDSQCCQHNTLLSSNLLFAILSTFILCGGLSLVLVSLEYLFEIDILHKTYNVIWILGTALFAPVYMLANTPTPAETANSKELIYPKGVTFIVRYLLCPLLLVYTAILYAYAAKILFQMELPKGNLTYMVITYSGIGFLTYLTAYPLAQAGIAIAHLIRNHFFKLLTLPILLIFIAIGVRILDYGITWQRYAVVAFTLWLAGSALYMIFSQRKSFNLITSVLVVMLVAASIGPWGANSVSISSQQTRLKNILHTFDLLNKDGIIKPTQAPENFTNKQVSLIHSMVSYLENYDKGGDWEALFPSDSKDTKPTSTNHYMTQLGFPNSQQSYYGGRHNIQDQPFSHEMRFQRQGRNTDFIFVKGYDYQGRSSQYVNSGNYKKKSHVRLGLADNQLSLETQMSATGITIYQEKKRLGFLNLVEVYKALQAKGITLNVSKKDRTLLDVSSTQNAAGWKFKILLNNLKFKETKGEVKLTQYNGKLLIKTP
ncbi:MAG: DUF4153 domain-containing protein [Rickettsiales bacterium]|nr:DUF4153 domain-containing protein [Rickettsiales bacterium]